MPAQLLSMHRVEKPWGRHRLWPGFDDPSPDGEPVGEVWFQAPDDSAPDLLIKYLFTSEKLSIQVHPSDAEAQALGLASGKEECWLVLNAEPGACLGIGTQRPLSADELRAAALSGEIEALMDWKPVERGDFYYIPAGTVHAIGAGVSLIEVQQNADITYRLYDYGRPRELHLEDGVAVSRAQPYPDELHRKVDFAVDRLLVDGPLFSLLLTGDANARLNGTGPLMVIPVEGSVTLERNGTTITVGAGECAAAESDIRMSCSPGARLLLARAIG